MKYLGIDFGTKRVGIAVSDQEGQIAFPHVVLENNTDLLSKVTTIVNKENVGVVVVGESRNSKDVDNPIMVEARAFADALRKAAIEVAFQSEAMTSSHVSIGEMMRSDRRRGKQTFTPAKNLDASAAALILQRFLDKQAKS